MPLISVNQVELHYDDSGEGHPLLVIPGLGVPGLVWMSQLGPLARRFRIIALDSRGIGDSAAPPGPWSVADLGADAAGLLEGLRIERAHVLGSSMGTFVAMQLAATRPGKVSRLVLCNACPRLPQAARDRVLLWQRMRRAGVPDELWLQDQLMWTLPDEYFENPSLVQMLLQGSIKTWGQTDRQGYENLLQAALDYDGFKTAPQVRAQALVLSSRDDRMIPAGYGEDLSRLLPRGSFISLPGGGHMPQFLTPRPFIQAISRFLEDGAA